MFGGDKELDVILGLKQFIKVNMEMDTMKDAEMVARAFQRNRNHDRNTIHPMPPMLETTITQNSNGKFVVWYRDRT